MGTAVGQYATLAGVQARIMNSTTGDAAELQVFCDQVNAWIELTTHRVLAPLPTLTGTLASPAAAGDTTLTLSTAPAGLALEDELAVGPVTGVHESSNVIGVNGAVVTLGVPLVNAYLVGAPVERVYLRDGFEASSDELLPARSLVEPRGIIFLSALEIASYTRGEFALIPASDYWLRPTPQQRQPGWPATELYMTNIPSPTNPYPAFFPGYGNIRYWGQLGWPAIPTDVAGIAERAVVALWQMRAGGGAYTVNPMNDASENIPHLLSLTDWRTLQSYIAPSMGIL